MFQSWTDYFAFGPSGLKPIHVTILYIHYYVYDTTFYKLIYHFVDACDLRYPIAVQPGKKRKEAN